MSKELKTNREVLQAILDGENVQQLIKVGSWADVHSTPNVRVDSLSDCPQFTYRIKPKTIMIGGMEVPEPVRDVSELERGEEYYLLNLNRSKLYELYTWSGDDIDLRLLKRGLVHKTEEAALLHAKALVKVSGGSY